MKNIDFEKYVTELAPELQEKARHCKNAEELNELMAANDVELSEDALAAVAGGGTCSCSDSKYSQGDETDKACPMCGVILRYWDRVSDGEGTNRLYCPNPECRAYNNGLWYAYKSGMILR